MGAYFDAVLELEKKKAGQANSVTPRVTSQPKSPQPVQPVYKRQNSPLNSLKDVTAGLANIGNDASSTITRSTTNFVNNLPQMALGLGKDFLKGISPLGLAHAAPAFGRGFVAGAVDLVPSTVGFVGNNVIDAINSYNGNQVLQHLPQERIRPMHTALEQWKELQNASDALTIPVANGQTPEQLAAMGYKPVNGVSKYISGNMDTSDWGNLWQGAGEFAVPLGTINKAGAAIKAANQASKVSKLTPKITQELSTRVSPKAAAKYKEQIARMAEDRAKQEVANGIQAPGKFRKFAGEIGKFGAIGATEGESAEDRLTNTLGAMGVGAIAHGVGTGVKKGWNSEKGLEFRKNTADNFKQATDSWDWISKATAGVDATLNTNLSKNANGLTKIRRDYLKLRMANPSIAKIISSEQFKALVDAKKLTPEEYQELFETAKYGSRERAYNLAKQLEQKLEKNEAPEVVQENKQITEQQKQSKQETEKAMVSEDDLSHVKSETDINTPNDTKTPQNEPSIQPQNENMNYDFSSAKGQSLKYGVKSSIEHPNAKIDESKVTRIEGGTAEGADYGNWYEQRANAKPKRLGDENMYENYEVEGIKPTTDEELIQEIEAAKKQKDVPVIRSKVNTQQRTPAQRMFDRRHNEIKQKAWYRKLKNTKVKALNDDTKTKSMLDIIYEDVNKGNGKDFSSLENIEHITSNEAKEVSNFLSNNSIDISKLANKKVTLKNIANFFKTVKSDFINSLKNKHGNLEFNLIKGDKHTRGEIHFFENSKDDYVDINVNNANEHTVLHEVGHKAAVDEIRKNNNELKEYGKASEYSSLYTEHYNTYEQEIDRVGEYIKNNNINPRTQLEKLRNEYSGDKEDVNKFIRQLRLSDAYLNSVAEVHADLFAEGLIKDGEYVSVYKPAYNKAKNIFNELIKKGVIDGNPREFKELVREELRTKNSTKQGNQNNRSASSEVQGNVRGTGEERSDLKFSKLRIIKTLDWFDEGKLKASKFYETLKQPSSKKIKNLSDFLNNVSKSAEDLLLKYHRYTPERMKGRLFKQSQSGEGMYFLQGTEKSDRIVWKEDNGSSKYVKKLDGLKQKGSAEQTIARNLQRLAKMQHADACVSFLKEHFKDKKEGYVSVNSDLLFTGIVEGKSRAWLKTLMDGEESIRKTFDVNDAVEWTELYKTTDGGKADIYLPKDILAETLTGEKELALDYISTYGKRGFEGKVRGYAKLAGAMLDFYNDRFKRLVLTSGSFVSNNVFGNNIMLFANAESPADYIRSIGDAFKLKDEQIPPEVLESTLAKSIMQEMQGGRKYFSEKDGTLNTIARLIDGDLIDIKANDLHGTKRIAAHLANWGIARPNGVFRAISNAVGKINDGLERFSRKQAYSITLRKLNKQKMIKTAASMKGIEALAEAAKENKILRQTVVDKVEDILGDYNNFTNVEKKFFKRVFPFYAWNRTITRHIIHLAKDDPAMAFMVMYQTFRLLNQDDDLEDYQHGALKTKMYNQATKSNIVWNKANMIPYNTLFQMVAGEDHERVGTMSSAFTKPAEAIRGKKFFYDQEITSKGYKKVSVDGKSGYMNTNTGEFVEGEAPWQVRAGYLGKDLLEKTYPMMNSPLTKSLKDKQYDASLGGYNHGDYIGKVKTSKGYKKKYRAAKNRLDTKYKLLNRVTGGFQPEHKVSKEQKEKYKNQRKRMRGY